MSDAPSPFAAAAARFEAAHRDDPRAVARDGEALPHAVVYHRALVAWLARLAPDAPEAVQLAARCQHLRRWTRPRADYPEGRAGYKRWRSDLARFHAAEAGAILAASGYGPAMITRVGELLTKRRLASDPDVQLLEDAICLVFLDTELADFAAKHDDDKLVDIVRKTWAKMTPRGHAAALALAERLPERERSVLARALAGADPAPGPPPEGA
jgi:hypothetical protein